MQQNFAMLANLIIAPSPAAAKEHHVACSKTAPMDEANGQDEVLLSRIGKGDHDAFAEFVRRHEQWARTFAGRIIRDFDEGEDLAQDMFLKVWINAAKWKTRGTVRGWMATMLSRQCIDFLRKKRPVALHEDWNPPDLSPSIRERLERESAARRMASLIDLLPARQRMALALFYEEELSLREAGEAMELTEKGFESLLQRARTHLKALWRQEH